jgi:desumoylating isopeptidase 1
MDVELYVYDLSGGLARQYSQALIGQHIDAIYHTAIVLNNVEYFFGQGIHRKVPGSTHHGQPIKIVNLGRTDLPLDTIEEYVQSLESVYTPESYDLFLHNCNNFTQDLAMVLVGKSIPQEISSLPETFLRTPIGQMIRGQIDQSMRRMTQAPDAMSGTNATGRDRLQRPPASYATANGTAKPTSNGTAAQPLQATEFFNGKIASWTQPGQVWNITDRTALDKLLKGAEKNCAVIFFTSATCPPCKICYGPYDELASEAGNKATLIKVDVSKAYEIGSRYGVRATPTFMTFLHGQKYEEWSGADPARLRGSVQMLIHMANPQHPHTQLNLPSFHGLIQRPTLYTKIPPLDKLAAKLGIFGRDSSIQELINHIKTRTTSGEANAPMPDLRALSTYVSLIYSKVPITDRFALVDLIRVSAIDARVSSFLATETGLRTLSTLLTGIEWLSIPYQLRLVTCQLCCNLFSSPVFQDLVSAPSSTLRTYIDCLSDCLIAENPTARAAAAAVFYNLAAINHNERVQCRDDKFGISEDVEAALVSGVFSEGESKECMHSELLTLGVML